MKMNNVASNVNQVEPRETNEITMATTGEPYIGSTQIYSSSTDNNIGFFDQFPKGKQYLF